MEEVFQNGNYQREANANNMTAVETRKEVKEPVFHVVLANRYIRSLRRGLPFLWSHVPFFDLVWYNHYRKRVGDF